MNYDPNVSWSLQTVELSFQMWDYHLVAQTTIRGNCKGMSVLSGALSNFVDELITAQGEQPVLVLTRPAADGVGIDTLEHELFDVDDVEDELERMCVGLRIVAMTEEVRVKEAGDGARTC